jgi:uncharacterized protein (TIGR03067 family)
MDGGRVPEPRSARLIIDGDRGRFEAFVTVEGKVRLDPGKNPKELDLLIESFLGRGIIVRIIYSLKEDTLTTCRGVTYDSRPSSFQTTKGSGLMVETWKKGSE